MSRSSAPCDANFACTQAATVATVATVQPGSDESVATVATVAAFAICEIESRQPDQEAQLGFWPAFAAFASACPQGVEHRRWRMAIGDARIFLFEHGEAAMAKGWQAQDLFGLNAAAPMARFDAMGLVWLLKRRRVVALDETCAHFADGQKYLRNPLQAGKAG